MVPDKNKNSAGGRKPLAGAVVFTTGPEGANEQANR